MVINGPVAIAGSIPLLFKKRGMKVPIMPATITTATSDADKANAISISFFHMNTNKNNIKANMTPFKMDRNVSLISLLLILSLISSLARP